MFTELSPLLLGAPIATARSNVCRKVVALVSRISDSEFSKRREEVTKISIRRLLALGFAFAFPVAAYATDRIKPIARHQFHLVEPSALRANVDPPVSVGPLFFLPRGIAPFPPGQGDADGLSRHINDCNKGCIGGNPG